MKMKEIKQIILEDEEVDRYYDLLDKFEETVDEEVAKDISLKKNMRVGIFMIIIWLIGLIGLNKWL